MSRYDPAATLINYIQSRGRARHASSQYINLCEKSHWEAMQRVKFLQNEEINMKNVIRDDDDEDTFDAHGMTLPLRDDEIYTVESTGANCTIHTSTAYVHKYCDLLPKYSLHPTS